MFISPNSHPPSGTSNPSGSTGPSGFTEEAWEATLEAIPWKTLTDRFESDLGSASFVAGIDNDLRSMEHQLAKFASPGLAQTRRSPICQFPPA